ncbi:protein dispatched homolog 1-like [Babylonia areolata]|uniref:protein dispatched homolog 1-like n=1 Tax=Babylonia areolata TaxID=304850 RepID=UPI003FD343CC
MSSTESMECADRFMESFGSEDDSLLDPGNPEDAEENTSVPTKEPLKFCKLVANWPHVCFGVTLGVHVLFVAVSVGLIVSGYDLFPVDFTTLPLDLRDSVWFRRDLAWRGRYDYGDQVLRHLPADKQADSWPRAKRSEKSLLVLYDAGDRNIFTKDNLKVMQSIEDSLVKVKGYKDFCQLTKDGACTPAFSVLRLFDGTLSCLDPVFNDPHFDNIVQVLYKAYTHDVTKGWFRFALSKTHTINSSYVHVSYTRSIIPFGYPMKGKSYQQMIDATVNFMERKLKPLLERYLKTEQFTFLYYNEEMMIEDAKLQGFNDMKLAIGSVIFIFGFILFHTRSLWITILGVFSILCSFVETNLIYRVVIGYDYFGFFHVLVMFVILGIGADDLFVFWDAWKASELRHFPTLAYRLDETYRKSTLSMFVTSLTTMLAFLVSAISPLLAISSFGVFAAILVVIDYISVITFFPTIVVFYHLHFENKNLLRCCKGLKCCSHKKHGNASSDHSQSAGDNDDDDQQLLTDVEDAELNFVNSEAAQLHLDSNANLNETNTSSSTLACIDGDGDRPFENTISFNESPHNHVEASGPMSEACGLALQPRLPHQEPSTEHKDDKVTTTDPVTSHEHSQSLRLNHVKESPDTNPTDSRADGDSDDPDACEAQPEYRWLVLFFRDYYLRFVMHKVCRWLILASLLAIIVVFALSAARLKPDNQQVGLFKENHHYTRAFRLASGGFADNMVDTSIELVLLWGVRTRDLSPCSFSSYTCHGREVFDDTFDPNTEAAQQSLMNLCDTLHNFTHQEAEDLKIRRDINTGRLKIRCFMRELNTFLKNDAMLSDIDASLPWNRTTLNNFVTALSPHYNISHFNTSYHHYLDVAVNYWLWDGFRQDDTDDYRSFNSFMGEQATPYTTPLPSLEGVSVGNNLKFIVVAVATSLHYGTLSYVDHIPVVHRWEQFMQNQLSTMPPELKGGFQITEVAWHWLFIQKSLVDNAVLGVILGVSLTLPILVAATCNVINGLLATLTICCVTVCVIGVVPMAGWKLGVLVSLNMCIVVGLAVDYVVHLAEGYHMSHARDRKTRLKHALERMGISVFSGACTTLGASAFMLFAQIQFFYQFGIFMFCTIGFSLLFSLGLYTTLMGIVGPEGSTGDILTGARWCVTRLGACRLTREPETETETTGTGRRRTRRRSYSELDMTDDDDMLGI